jgi:two-component system, OmpR family, sensor kinase
MSASGSQIAPEKKNSVARDRSLLSHLLHALNQPLTGLQCSLELAVAGSRTCEQYIRTLRDGLELTARMRVLVEAIRELADSEQPESEVTEILSLDALVRETAEGLHPVAEAKQVQITLSGNASLPVRAGRQRLPAVIFRLLESALSLAEEESVLHIAMERQKENGRIVAGWNEAEPLPEYSPFSRPELGLLIASAGWKRAGGDWASERSGSLHTVTIRLPLTSQSKPL